MKRIGRGYWYRVYDLGNGRVLKIEKNLIEKITHSFFDEGMNLHAWIGALRKLLNNSSQILSTYKKLASKENLSILGNPKFFEGINYEQDKVRIIEDIIHDLSGEDSRKIIDQYIGNIINCWKNGFADQIYNFTINNGVDANGKMILIDFNEITFIKEDVLEGITSKRWIRSWSTKQLNEGLKEYYLNQMDRILTEDLLELNWPR